VSVHFVMAVTVDAS